MSLLDANKQTKPADFAHTFECEPRFAGIRVWAHGSGLRRDGPRLVRDAVSLQVKHQQLKRDTNSMGS